MLSVKGRRNGEQMKRCNGVFEGGGVWGIGHIGAAWEFEKAGFCFVNLAGSSAGAMVACPAGGPATTAAS